MWQICDMFNLYKSFFILTKFFITKQQSWTVKTICPCFSPCERNKMHFFSLRKNRLTRRTLITRPSVPLRLGCLDHFWNCKFSVDACKLILLRNFLFPTKHRFQWQTKLSFLGQFASYPLGADATITVSRPSNSWQVLLVTICLHKTVKVSRFKPPFLNPSKQKTLLIFASGFVNFVKRKRILRSGLVSAA